jgi:hypothetical protein
MIDIFDVIILHHRNAKIVKNVIRATPMSETVIDSSIIPIVAFLIFLMISNPKPEIECRIARTPVR